MQQHKQAVKMRMIINLNPLSFAFAGLCQIQDGK